MVFVWYNLLKYIKGYIIESVMNIKKILSLFIMFVIVFNFSACGTTTQTEVMTNPASEWKLSPIILDLEVYICFIGLVLLFYLLVN